MHFFSVHLSSMSRSAWQSKRRCCCVNRASKVPINKLLRIEWNENCQQRLFTTSIAQRGDETCTERDFKTIHGTKLTFYSLHISIHMRSLFFIPETAVDGTNKQTKVRTYFFSCLPIVCFLHRDEDSVNKTRISLRCMHEKVFFIAIGVASELFSEP